MKSKLLALASLLLLSASAYAGPGIEAFRPRPFVATTSHPVLVCVDAHRVPTTIVQVRSPNFRMQTLRPSQAKVCTSCATPTMERRHAWANHRGPEVVFVRTVRHSCDENCR